MRDWTKAMAALLAAVSSVGVVRIASAQEVPATEPAVKAEDAGDPFAKSGGANNGAQATGKDLTKEEFRVSDVGTIEIHVSDANLLDVLRTFSVQLHKNIVPAKTVGGRVTANLFNVTVREALDAILHSNGYAYREKGNFIYVYPVDELKKIEREENKPVTQVFRLNYTPASVMIDMIKPALSPEAITAVTKAPIVGLPTGTTDVGGNSLATEDAIVVTDYPENIAEIKRLIKEMDRRPQQILIESTILQATLNDNNSLGIDFSILGGADFSSVGSTNSAALTNNSIGTANTPGGGNPATPEAAFSNNGYNTVGTNVKGPENRGLNVGVAYNNIAFFVNALEQVTDTVVLANPKVLTLNKQAGTVIVGRKDGYYTTTTTSTYTTQTVEYLETGTRLIFRPYIADEGFIRMEIHPEDSSGSVNNGLPSKRTTEVTSNVMVRDGHTIVIGGLFREENSTSKSQVPLLGDIPIAGYLFKQQSDSAKREEVIILITPHVIKDYSIYSEVSEDALKFGDMIRVGIRKGMMPWSRDRLAELYYQKARTEMSEKYYDREKAMWYLDCATNLNPLFTEALVAKQQISGKLLMESDNSDMRSFLTNLVAEERMGKTPAVEPATPGTKPEPAPAPKSEETKPAPAQTPAL